MVNPRRFPDSELVERNPKLDVDALHRTGSLFMGQISRWACHWLTVTGPPSARGARANGALAEARAVFDRHVLPFDITRLFEALTECRHHGPVPVR